jgi:hypothetical protein
VAWLLGCDREKQLAINPEILAINPEILGVNP